MEISSFEFPHLVLLVLCNESFSEATAASGADSNANIFGFKAAAAATSKTIKPIAHWQHPLLPNLLQVALSASFSVHPATLQQSRVCILCVQIENIYQICNLLAFLLFGLLMSDDIGILIWKCSIEVEKRMVDRREILNWMEAGI